MELLRPDSLRLPSRHAQADAAQGDIEKARSIGDRASLRFVDWIWHISGSMPLAPEQSSDEALGKLVPLFRQPGTSYERTGDTLTFRKKDPIAQDKMSVFDDGVLRIEKAVTGSVLQYHLTSRILLLCFLAPLLFLSFAGLTIVAGKFEKPPAKESKKKKDEVLPQNAIDKFLGAPAPEKPRKDGADKSEEDDNKLSPTSAYVFAALFASLYAVGRILESRLIKALFKKKLLES